MANQLTSEDSSRLSSIFSGLLSGVSNRAQLTPEQITAEQQREEAVYIQKENNTKLNLIGNKLTSIDTKMGKLVDAVKNIRGGEGKGEGSFWSGVGGLVMSALRGIGTLALEGALTTIKLFSKTLEGAISLITRLGGAIIEVLAALATAGILRNVRVPLPSFGGGAPAGRPTLPPLTSTSGQRGAAPSSNVVPFQPRSPAASTAANENVPRPQTPPAGRDWSKMLRKGARGAGVVGVGALALGVLEGEDPTELIGGTIGAAIVGGVGAALGGPVGAVIGGMIGNFIGEKIGNTIGNVLTSIGNKTGGPTVLREGEQSSILLSEVQRQARESMGVVDLIMGTTAQEKSEALLRKYQDKGYKIIEDETQDVIKPKLSFAEIVKRAGPRSSRTEETYNKYLEHVVKSAINGGYEITDVPAAYEDMLARLRKSSETSTEMFGPPMPPELVPSTQREEAAEIAAVAAVRQGSSLGTVINNYNTVQNQQAPTMPIPPTQPEEPVAYPRDMWLVKQMFDIGGRPAWIGM